VFVRIGKICLVLALVTMLGAHWALLQTVAWTTMLADNLHSNSFQYAVAKTFDGHHPCPICQAIAAGKKIREEIRSRFANTETGIPAGQGKIRFDRADAVSTAADGTFLRKIPLPKAAASAAARIPRLIQSQFGCPRRVDAG